MAQQVSDFVQQFLINGVDKVDWVKLGTQENHTDTT